MSWLAVLLLLVVPTVADELSSAAKVYSDQHSESPEGVYSTNDLLFIVVEVADADAMKEVVLESRCLIRTAELLRQYAADHQDADAALHQNPVLEAFPFLFEACRQHNPRFATSDFQLNNVPTRILEKRRVQTRFRYVTAVTEAVFRKNINASSKEVVTVEATIKCLREYFDLLREDESEQLVNMLIRCGAIETALNIANDECSIDFTLSSFGTPKLDSLSLYEQWPVATSMLEGDNVDVKGIRRLLRDWPGFPPALRWLHHSYADQAEYAASLNFLILSQVDRRNERAENQEVTDFVRLWHRVNPEASLIEFAELMDAVEENGKKIDERLSLTLSITLERSIRTIGHLNFPMGSVLDPTEVKPEQIHKADSIAAAAVRFEDSISENPANAETWLAMGISLADHQDSLSAIPFLNQAMRLTPRHPEAPLRLAECYRVQGKDKLARGMALATLLVGELSGNQTTRVMTFFSKPDSPALTSQIEHSEK